MLKVIISPISHTTSGTLSSDRCITLLTAPGRAEVRTIGTTTLLTTALRRTALLKDLHLSV